jgi:lipid II:glycine glycyltransferase (peptidoglycan interpeptide bridge formation enzyme)
MGYYMAGQAWNRTILSLPDPHLLQTAQWAELKANFGWQPYYLVWTRNGGKIELIISQTGDLYISNPAASALILERKLLPGISVLYVPKGPLLQDWSDPALVSKVLEDLMDFGRERGAIQVKIDPDVLIGRGLPGQADASQDLIGKNIQIEMEQSGWIFSREQIQFRNTFWIDLLDEEEKLLEQMKSKTRYNIRLSGRKGIQTRFGNQSDLAELYKMYADTSVRGGFTIRGEDYYRTLWDLFLDPELNHQIDPIAQPIIAEYEGQPVAGAIFFRFGRRTWYLHGMSLPDHSDKMPTYLVQWEGIRWARSNGCAVYDMWGAPDQFDESDPLWGVFRFKNGFGGEVIRTLGAWDYPNRPILYYIYTRLLPVFLGRMRRIGDRQTAEIASQRGS